MDRYYELQQTAFTLYDGDWRAEDREQLMSEYGFSADEVKIVCEVLADIEADEYTRPDNPMERY